MKVVIGIDVGGSTTKIVGFRMGAAEPTLIEPLFVRAADPITSIYGAFGKFTAMNGLELNDIDRVMMTGVGSTYITKPIYSLPCETVAEFTSIGLGGLYLSGLEEAIVVSLGTGTAIVHAKRGGEIEYLGGTGVGGGTLVGLSKLLLKMDSVEHISALAEEGDLFNIDLRISDMTRKDRLTQMPSDLTASNFGKVSDIATRADIALGVLNMVFETVGMVAYFAAKGRGVKDIIMTGNLTTSPLCAKISKRLSEMFHVNFCIPERAQFGTVIGTALIGATGKPNGIG
jgi:type II pantothenate kinase